VKLCILYFISQCKKKKGIFGKQASIRGKSWLECRKVGVNIVNA
jgi:hypothetical protein